MSKQKYFAQVNFVIEADDEAQADALQEQSRKLVSNHMWVVEARADEPVEPDEFGHAG